ncbi:MAG: MFS transporter [Nitrososphaeria archaeon]
MSSFKYSSQVEETRWLKTHWWVFFSFAVGMILEGYSFALSSVVSTWFTLPVFFRVLSVMWSTLWLAVGVMIFGPITDRIGRKKTFFISMSIFAIAGLLIIFTYNYVMMLLSIGLLTFAGGAEQNVIMTSMHEYYPRKNRSKAYMITLDTIELGSVLSGIVSSFSFSSSPIFSKEIAGITVLIIILLLIFIRLHMPESVRWLESVGKSTHAEEETAKYYGRASSGNENIGNVSISSATSSMGASVMGAVATKAAVSLETEKARIKSRKDLFFRFIITLILADTNTVTYGLVTYTLGPIYYTNLIPEILMIGTLAAFFGGLIGLGADRWSRKRLLVYSYLLSLASFVLFYILVPVWVSNIWVFWLLLILAEIWPQLAWESADALKSEIWPTNKRGTFVGLNRGLTFIISIPFLFIASLLTVSQYMMLSVLWWVAGFAAAVIWYIWGVESGKSISIGVPSGEV